MNTAISIGMIVIGIVLFATGLWILRGSSAFRGKHSTLAFIIIALGVSLVAVGMSTLGESSPPSHLIE